MRRSERVVLLDEHRRPIGSADKVGIHGPDTPLHLAFSCYLQDEEGRILVTRRALAKRTWPGVWTNSFCGHPSPGEPLHDAVRRRGRQELGAAISGIREALPDFRYRAADAGGIVENEVCPVFIADLDGAIHPEPEEVVEWSWVHPLALAQSIALTPFAFSPWLREQLPLLIRHRHLEGADRNA
ncbi:MAG: isopentenyl-diphosphate Delta-isomerase [Leucobacter sp.]